MTNMTFKERLDCEHSFGDPDSPCLLCEIDNTTCPSSGCFHGLLSINHNDDYAAFYRMHSSQTA